MIVLLQALLRLLLVALAAVGTWAGAKLDLPGTETGGTTTADLESHTADVFARIESTGLANPPKLVPTVPAPEAAATSQAPEAKKDTPSPAAKPTGVVSDAPVAAPKKIPAPPEPKNDEPEQAAKPTWIESKLPIELYDPLGGAEADTSDTDEEMLAKETTVNLACVRKEGSTLRITSGSGVVVSPDGLIMTDAHVAYFFLLGKDGVGCSITHPSYPIFGYPGQVVYISPDWVRQNEHVIGGAHTTATGAEDYAFVAFSPGSAPTSLGALAYAPVSTAEPVAKAGDEVVVAGYPGVAENPEGYGASSRLKVGRVEIDEAQSFAGKTADILKTDRTEVAATGSSGGGAFKDGKLVGLTVTVFPLGRGYGLNSLSTAWINRDLRADANVSIASLIAENPDAAAGSFWEAEGAALAKIVRAALD